MKELLEKNKWLTGYLAVVVVSLVSFSLFVQAQGADASAQKKEKDKMKKKLDAVNKFAKANLEVTEDNLSDLKKSQSLVSEDLEKLKSFLHKNHKYEYDRSWQDLSGLQVKQKMIDTLKQMKKLLREGEVYYEKDSYFGFEKYVKRIPSKSDAVSLTCFGGITMDLLKIATTAKISEVLEVQSTNKLKLTDALVGRYASYKIRVAGTGETVKSFLAGLKESKSLYVVIKKMTLASVEQMDSEHNPSKSKGGQGKDSKNKRKAAVVDAVRQAKVAFEKAPVLNLDIDVNIYLLEER